LEDKVLVVHADFENGEYRIVELDSEKEVIKEMVFPIIEEIIEPGKRTDYLSRKTINQSKKEIIEKTGFSKSTVNKMDTVLYCALKEFDETHPTSDYLSKYINGFKGYEKQKSPRESKRSFLNKTAKDVSRQFRRDGIYVRYNSPLVSSSKGMNIFQRIAARIVARTQARYAHLPVNSSRIALDDPSSLTKDASEIMDLRKIELEYEAAEKGWNEYTSKAVNKILQETELGSKAEEPEKDPTLEELFPPRPNPSTSKMNDELQAAINKALEESGVLSSEPTEPLSIDFGSAPNREKSSAAAHEPETPKEVVFEAPRSLKELDLGEPVIVGEVVHGEPATAKAKEHVEPKKAQEGAQEGTKPEKASQKASQKAPKPKARREQHKRETPYERYQRSGTKVKNKALSPEEIKRRREEKAAKRAAEKTEQAGNKAPKEDIVIEPIGQDIQQDRQEEQKASQNLAKLLSILSFRGRLLPSRTDTKEIDKSDEKEAEKAGQNLKRLKSIFKLKGRRKKAEKVVPEIGETVIDPLTDLDKHEAEKAEENLLKILGILGYRGTVDKEKDFDDSLIDIDEANNAERRAQRLKRLLRIDEQKVNVSKIIAEADAEEERKALARAARVREFLTRGRREKAEKVVPEIVETTTDSLTDPDKLEAEKAQQNLLKILGVLGFRGSVKPGREVKPKEIDNSDLKEAEKAGQRAERIKRFFTRGKPVEEVTKYDMDEAEKAERDLETVKKFKISPAKTVGALLAAAAAKRALRKEKIGSLEDEYDKDMNEAERSKAILERIRNKFKLNKGSDKFELTEEDLEKAKAAKASLERINAKTKKIAEKLKNLKVTKTISGFRGKIVKATKTAVITLKRKLSNGVKSIKELKHKMKPEHKKLLIKGAVTAAVLLMIFGVTKLSKSSSNIDKNIKLDAGIATVETMSPSELDKETLSTIESEVAEIVSETVDSEIPSESGTHDTEKPDDGKTPDTEKPDEGKTSDTEKPDEGKTPDTEKPDEGKTPDTEKPDEGKTPDTEKPDEGKTPDTEKPDEGKTPDTEKPDEGKTPDTENPDEEIEISYDISDISVGSTVSISEGKYWQTPEETGRYGYFEGHSDHGLEASIIDVVSPEGFQVIRDSGKTIGEIKQELLNKGYKEEDIHFMVHFVDEEGHILGWVKDDSLNE
jgi:hypothetical protein